MIDGAVWLAERAKALSESKLATHCYRAIMEGRVAEAPPASTDSPEPAAAALLLPYTPRKFPHTRCARCHRMLTADTVAVLGDVPYGPECIQKIDGGELATLWKLKDWLEQDKHVAPC